MDYYEDMLSKWGFNDGDAVPPDARMRRTVYVRAINVVATRRGSSVRAIAWDRPGMHNSCLIIAVPVDFYATLSPTQIADVCDAPLPEGPEPSDDAWEETVAECMTLGLDAYVVTVTRIADDFAQFVERLKTSPVEEEE